MFSFWFLKLILYFWYIICCEWEFVWNWWKPLSPSTRLVHVYLLGGGGLAWLFQMTTILERLWTRESLEMTWNRDSGRLKVRTTAVNPWELGGIRGRNMGFHTAFCKTKMLISSAKINTLYANSQWQKKNENKNI